MRLRHGLTPAAIALMLLTVPAWASIATAQQQTPPSGMGEVVGEVVRCAGTLEIPVLDASVGIQDGQSSLAQTDSTGAFSLVLAPGMYSIAATGGDGSSALRPDVPVSADQVLDIGILDLGAEVSGCGDTLTAPQAQPSSAQGTSAQPPTPAPALPTVTPSSGDSAASD